MGKFNDFIDVALSCTIVVNELFARKGFKLIFRLPRIFVVPVIESRQLPRAVASSAAAHTNCDRHSLIWMNRLLSLKVRSTPAIAARNYRIFGTTHIIQHVATAHGLIFPRSSVPSQSTKRDKSCDKTQYSDTPDDGAGLTKSAFLSYGPKTRTVAELPFK